MAQSLYSGNVGRVIEAPLIGGRLGDNKVSKFLGKHCSQAGFVGKNVDEAATEHDSVADCKRLQRAGQEHATMDFRLDVEIVGYLNIIHDGFEDLINRCRRRQQSDALQAIQNVQFRLMLPFPFSLDWRAVLIRGRLILNGIGRLDGELAEFFLAADVLEVIAPQARLRFEAHVIAEKILQVGFLAENERGQPKSGLKIRTPAVEMQIKAVESRDRCIDAVETDDCEVLIFGPYAALKAASAGLGEGREIKNEATHFA